jgi:predicted phosphodiesterase
MRAAALYDIHGNLPALEAVLQDMRQSEVDQVVVGGDVIPGPMPRETIACLLDLPIPVRFIQGNGEAAVLQEMAGVDTAGIPEQAREAVRWVAQQLRPEDEQLIARWPKVLRLEVCERDVLFCHATPRSDVEIFTRLTAEECLLPIFQGLGVSTVVCGHTHMQFDRLVGSTRVLNAGSVGMPFGKPGAYWLLLGPNVELRHTPYDLATAAERIQCTDYPQAQHFAAYNVLQPPSEEEMLGAFKRVELS